ncbi:MAG TPA: DinB family protein [Terriglobia bacterium]|nr:DinB family protein [Terriglobia bacterium]
MDLLRHFQMLARYNRIANERLYAKCAELDDTEYRRHRRGSFGSIHALLNHILLGDQIWMARFQGEGRSTPALDTILFDDFSALRSARVDEDSLIESFFEHLDAAFLGRSFSYTNNLGRNYIEKAPVAVSHFFNHQTHHRAQVHVMLSQTSVSPPSLDLHRIINPW